MPLPEAHAITIIWSNILPEHAEAIRKWHNLEHTTERLEGPGYIALHRYNREGGDGRHGRLNIFEGADLATFNSPYYLKSRNNPTPWTRQSMKLISDAERSVCELTASCGGPLRIEAPYLYTVRFSTTADERNLIAWFNEEQLPRMCAIEGVMRGRLFRRDLKLSKLKTEETRIHQMKTIAKWSFISLYELSTIAPLNTQDWKEAVGGAFCRSEMIKKLVQPVHESWWLDFMKYAPGVLA